MICFGNDVVPPSWTLMLPESWDESKTDFEGELDGPPSSLSLFLCFSSLITPATAFTNIAKLNKSHSGEHS